ncbi:MAG TPA: GNAT family protein [Candidatus Paceibacterota bacterium]|nr:GNAT family protein [Candidatus Paceibacterota bacterium]
MQLELKDFDKDFFETLQDKEEIFMSDKGVYYTIIYDGHKAGVVGYIPVGTSGDTGFTQTVLAPEFRGKGLSGAAKELMVKKHGLKTLLATIRKGNIVSIKANEKIGFKMLSEEKMAELRAKGFLKEGDIRMEKRYK